MSGLFWNLGHLTAGPRTALGEGLQHSLQELHQLLVGVLPLLAFLSLAGLFGSPCAAGFTATTACSAGNTFNNSLDLAEDIS